MMMTMMDETLMGIVATIMRRWWWWWWLRTRTSVCGGLH